MATETEEVAADLGLNPADLVTPDDAAGTRANVLPEIVGAQRQNVRGFPYSYADEPEMDQLGLDVRMSRLLEAGEDVPGKKEQLGAYRDYRTKRGEETFAYLDQAKQREEGRAFREQLPMWRRMFSSPENFTAAFPVEQRQALDQTFAGSMDPDADKRATANKMLFTAMTGQEVDDDLWPIQRTRYAQDALGWRGASGAISGDGALGVAPTVIGDEAFYNLAKHSLDEQHGEQQTTEKIYQASMKAAINGQPLTEGFAEAKKLAGPEWKRYETAAKQGFASILTDYRDKDLANMRPIYEDWAARSGVEAKDIAASPAGPSYAEYGRMTQAERQKWNNGIGLMAYTDGQDITNYFARIYGAGAKEARGLGSLLASSDLSDTVKGYDRLLEKGVLPADIAPDGDPAALIKEGPDGLSERMRGMGTSVRQGLTRDTTLPKSAATIPVRQMTAGERKQLEEARDATKGFALFLADSQTAGIQADRYRDGKMEGFWDTVGDVGVMMAESAPVMVAAALPYGVGLPAVVDSYRARNASQYRRNGMSEADAEAWALPSALVEAGIDRVQIMTLGAKVPKIQAWLYKWGAPGAVVNFGIRTAGVAAAESTQEVAQDLTAPMFQEFANAVKADIPSVDWDAVLAKEKEALGDIAAVSLGFALVFGGGGSIVDYVDAGRVGALLKDRDAIEMAGISPLHAKAIVERAQTSPASAAEMMKSAAIETPVAERQANSAAAIERVQSQQSNKDAGLPVLEKMEDGRVQISYPDRAAEIVEGNEAALDAVRLWEKDTDVSISQANRQLIDFLEAYHAEGTDIQFEGREVSSLGTIAEMAEGSAERTTQAKNRVQIALRQAGIDMGLDEIDLTQIPIIGSSENTVEAGITSIAAKVAKGASPLTVIEEHAEGIAKYLISNANVGPQKMIGWIRQTEQKTGQQILPVQFDVNSQTSGQEIVEAWSYLAQANATGRVDESSLPSQVKAFFRAFKEAIHAALRIAADFVRVRGELDPEFTYWLDVSAGVNEDFQRDRQEQAVNEELAGELGQTFSIALPQSALADIIAKQAKEPEEKAQAYKRMLKRVNEINKAFAKQLQGGETDLGRFRQIRDIATLEAVVKSLPVAIRGKIAANFRKLADLRTSPARQEYIASLIPKVEAALEKYLQSQYRQAIRATLKKGEVKVSDSRTRGGKISPEGHDIFKLAKEAMAITDDPPEQADGKTAVEKIAEQTEALTAQIEGAAALTMEQLDLLDAKRAALELFYDYENADSARLEQALEFLKETYQEGRKEWLEVLAGRKEVKKARIAAIRSGLALGGMIHRGDRSAAKEENRGTLTSINEGFLAMALSGSQKIRRLAELSDDPAVAAVVNDMEQAFASSEALESDLNAADQEAVKRAIRDILGVSTEYGAAKKLRELSDSTKDIPVTTLEGFSEDKISVPIDFIEALVSGEIDGFDRKNGDREEMSQDDIAALQEAWDAYQELGEDEQKGRRVISFTRRVAKGERLSLGKWSQLEALQLWLTMRQPDQAAKLERMGYDQRTMEELEKFLPEDVKALGLWMVERIGQDAFSIDALHRLEKGVGLLMIGNYFPVRNSVSRADNTGLSLDGNPQLQAGRSVGFIKQRVRNQAEPAQVNALSVFLQHRAQSNFWRSHVTALREWGSIVKDESFKDAVETRMGEKYYRSLKTLIERIENGGVMNARQQDDLDKLIKGLTRRFAQATLGLRASTLLVNTTAVLNATFEIPAADLIKGAMQVAKRPEAFKDAWNSPAIQRRLRDGSTFEAQLARRTGPTTRPTLAFLESLAQKGVKPINYVDTAANMFGAVAVWEYTKNASLRSGMSEEQAKAAADAKVDQLLLRAAQPTSRLARSEFEQKAQESPLGALFSLFVSEPRKNFAITYLAARELLTGRGTYGKKQAAQQLVVGMFLMMAAENIARSFYQAFANAKDDEEDEVWERFTARMSDPKAWGYKFTTQYLQNIPILGEAWQNVMASMWNSEKAEVILEKIGLESDGPDIRVFPASQNPLVPAFQASKTVAKDLMDDDDSTMEESIDQGITLAQKVGAVIPGGQIVGQLGNVGDFIEGVHISAEERLDRKKGQYNKFSDELDELYGPTMKPTGATKNGKPVKKEDKEAKAKKDRAKADWIRGETAPLPEAERKAVIEAIDPSQDIEKLMR